MIRLFAVSLLAGAVIAGGLHYASGTSTSSLPALNLGAAEAQEADIDTSSIVEMTLGSEDAPVEVIEYASYTCPHCASFHNNVFKSLRSDYIDTGKVHFVYREVYFDRYGLWASMVARCGGEMRFFGISEILYAEQSDWLASRDPATIADELRKIGRKAGLEQETLDACLSDAAKAETLVAWYQENAQADDIDSTPSFIIDGTKYTNMGYEEFSRILNEKLAE